MLPVHEEVKCSVTCYPASQMGHTENPVPKGKERLPPKGRSWAFLGEEKVWHGLGIGLMGRESSVVGQAGLLSQSPETPVHLCLGPLGAWAQPESPEDRALDSGGDGEGRWDKASG